MALKSARECRAEAEGWTLQPKDKAVAPVKKQKSTLDKPGIELGERGNAREKAKSERNRLKMDREEERRRQGKRVGRQQEEVFDSDSTDEDGEGVEAASPMPGVVPHTPHPLVPAAIPSSSRGAAALQVTDPTRGGGILHSLVYSIDPEDPEGAQVRLKKFADCGIFTREQLSHTLSTRATKGLTLPYEAYFRGRCFLINELIATCSSGETEPVEVADVLEAGLEARKGRDLGAATVTSDGRSAGVNVEAALASALIVVNRLDIRASLVRIGITVSRTFASVLPRWAALLTATPRCASQSVALFMAATEGLESGNSIISLEINKKMRAAGERVLAEGTLTALRDFCTPG